MGGWLVGGRGPAMTLSPVNVISPCPFNRLLWEQTGPAGASIKDFSAGVQNECAGEGA
jgi:hypothetical protein